MKFLNDQWKLDLTSFLTMEHFSMPSIREIIDYLESNPPYYLPEKQVEEIA